MTAGGGLSSRVSEPAVAELVIRFQNGQAEALEGLHGQLEPSIKSMLRGYYSSRLPSSLTAQDLHQQSWVILAELARRWRPRGSFIGYFFHSFPRLVERYVNSLRSQGAAAVHGGPGANGRLTGSETRAVAMLVFRPGALGDALAESAPPYSVERDATPGPLDEALSGLSAVERTAFVLYALEGQDFAAIGQLLDVSRASAHRLYRQARLRLARKVSASAARPGGTPIERLVAAMHAFARPDGRLTGRRRLMTLAGVSRSEYDGIVSQLESSGALIGRAPGHAGRLLARSARETLDLARGRAS